MSNDLLNFPGVKSFSAELIPSLPLEKAKKFIDIPEEKIYRVSAYVDLVFKLVRNNKRIDVESVIKNAKILFLSGARYNDNLWFQHCAASLRETIVFIEPQNICKVYKNIQYHSADEMATALLDSLMNIKAYLSDVAHFVPKPRRGWCDKIFSTTIYGELTEEQFDIIEKEYVFEMVCIEYIYKLDELFCLYCFDNN